MMSSLSHRYQPSSATREEPLGQYDMRYLAKAHDAIIWLCLKTENIRRGFQRL